MGEVGLAGLSPEQLRIATTLKGALFVEAGAGSGKTFTLTRRVAQALCPGSGEGGAPFLDGLSQVLVITFTNAAAREIRERVRSTLRDAGMREAALQVDSAWISTIHGMCSRILRRHALDLGLDPAFRMATENETSLLQNRALIEVVGAAHASGGRDEDQAVLFDSFGLGRATGASRTGAMRVVDRLCAVAKAATGGFDGLKLAQAADIGQAMGSLLGAYESLHAQRLTPSAAQRVDPALDLVRDFASRAPGQQDASAARELLCQVRSIGFPRPSKAYAEFVFDLRRVFEETWADVVLSESVPALRAALALARTVEKRYGRLKSERSLLDNDDLIGLALAAVRDKAEVAADYAGRFRLVMVDEFQDTDARQLELIGLLAGGGWGRVATVGDAQQSIYRFRGADVGVFREHGRRVPEAGHVRMATNYRSHADVLSFVDAVCGGRKGVLADFMHLEASPGRRDGYRASALDRIDVELVCSDHRSRGVATGVVATCIAERLKAYADAGQSAGDMALLLGTTTHAADYIDAIRARGLECVVTGGSTFTSAPEVGVMAALLHALANPHDTEPGLFPLLASEMFELGADDFVQLGTRPQLVLDAPTKRTVDRGLETMGFYGDEPPSASLRRARDVLWRARQRLRSLPVADVCLEVVRESGWLARLEEEGQEGRSREANVLAAIDYIRDLTDELGLGPARAAGEFDTWLELSKIPPAALAGGGQDSVRVMTIHASKGLEFPICAVAECWSDPRPESGVVSGRDSGGETQVVLVPPLADKERIDLSRSEPCERPSSVSEVLAQLRSTNALEDAQERTRLLYVGMTRAREALILGIQVIQSKSSGLGPELSAGVVNALFGTELPAPGEHALSFGEGGAGRLRSVRVSTREDYVEIDDGAGPQAQEAQEEPERAPSRTFTLFDVERSDIEARASLAPVREGIFSYSSVSAQLRANAREALGRELGAAWDETPATNDEDRATNLGSAFHELAQALVESGAYEPGEARLGASVRRWGLSPRAQGRLRAALGRWCGSELRAEARSHSLVRAEVPFFMRVDSAYGEYVEGSIDLLATDAGSRHALVVDYKTGDAGLSEEELRAHHEMQANFYASVLMQGGLKDVECAFCCVERDASELGGRAGQPLVVRYRFDGKHPPRLGS